MTPQEAAEKIILDNFVNPMQRREEVVKIIQEVVVNITDERNKIRAELFDAGVERCILINEREDLFDRQEKTIERLQEKIDQQANTIIELKEELAHYRAAVSAVKWLWDQAQKQRKFQL